MSVKYRSCHGGSLVFASLFSQGPVIFIQYHHHCHCQRCLQQFMPRRATTQILVFSSSIRRRLPWVRCLAVVSPVCVFPYFTLLTFFSPHSDSFSLPLQKTEMEATEPVPQLTGNLIYRNPGGDLRVCFLLYHRRLRIYIGLATLFALCRA